MAAVSVASAIGILLPPHTAASWMCWAVPLLAVDVTLSVRHLHRAGDAPSVQR